MSCSPTGCSRRPIIRSCGWKATSALVPGARARRQEPGTTAQRGGKPRLQTGGELRAPAIELVDAARSLGKLDELAARVEGIKLEGNDDGATGERARLAMLGLIALARGDDGAAAKALESIKPLLSKLVPDAPTWQRWPELCLVTRALPGPRFATKPRPWST